MGAGNTNDGLIDLLGGTAEFTQDLTNNATIRGNGMFIVSGGLTNHGTIATTATTTVASTVANGTGGVLLASGGTTTYMDAVVNDGEIRTGTGSTSQFDGTVSGAGTFGGTGTVRFNSSVCTWQQHGRHHVCW